MSDKELRLQVVFAALDKLTAPMKKIVNESTTLGKAIKATNDKLKDLNARQKDIGEFRAMRSGLQETSTKLEAAQRHVAGLAQRIKQTDSPTRVMTREFSAAVKAAGALKMQAQQQGQQLQVLRSSLSGAGISTRDLGAAQTALKSKIASTNAELTAQQKRLAATGAQQQRVTVARQHTDKLRTVAGNVASAGVGATIAGGVVGAPIVKGLQEAKHYQTETGRVTALGLGPQVSADAEKYARNMKTFGTSHTENLELVRDSMSVFGDLPHAQMVAPTLAKMKFGNKAFYGEESGEENERKFMDMLKVIETRGGTANSDTFHGQANMVQKVISATGGRVGPSEWLNFIKTGGIAAKIMDDKSFYYEMEPLVQEIGGHRTGTALMSGYQNLYQGRTSKRAIKNIASFGLIGDASKVTHDKAGQVSYLNPGALLGSDLFRKSQFQWMEQILLPQLAKRGITKHKDVEDAIGSMFSTRTAASQFVQMFNQRAQIHKNAKLNAGAYDIDQINTLGQRMTSGKELNASTRLADLMLVMGEKILPLYSSAIETVTVALDHMNGFIEKNPTLAKVMIVSFGVLAGLLVVIGPLMLGLATLIGPYALLHVMFAKMGIQGGVLMPILRGIGSAFLWLGRAALIAGRAMLMNPIGLVITAIALAAFLVYKYWEPIKTFFIDLWNGVTNVFNLAWASIKAFAGGIWSDVKQAFDGGIMSINALVLNWSPLGLFYQAFAGVMTWFGFELPAKFSTFGANIMEGLVNGITGALGWVKATIAGAGDSVIGWFKEKLGIHSPSRVFAELGDFTMQGLAVGLQRSEDGPIGQVGGLAKRLTQLGAGIAISAAAMPAMAFDTRPPISPRTAGAGATYQGDTIQITIQAAPGMDEQAIARAVAQVLEQRDRQKSARRRSSFSDNHD
jgi:hypothetical protein